MGNQHDRAPVSNLRQFDRKADQTCRRRGWRVLESVDEAGLAGQGRNAPGLEQAVRVLESGAANALLAAKRERLEQALGELAALLVSAQAAGMGARRARLRR